MPSSPHDKKTVRILLIRVPGSNYCRSSGYLVRQAFLPAGSFLDIPHTLMIVYHKHSTARSLFAKQPTHPPQDAVLLRIIGVVFAGYFKDSWEGGGVGVDAVAYAVSDLE